jgi:hypothetical protein
VNAVASDSISLIDIDALRTEAAEARRLAVKFKDRDTVTDLLSYAAALEGDAKRCEEMFCPRESALTAAAPRRSLWTNLFRASLQH